MRPRLKLSVDTLLDVALAMVESDLRAIREHTRTVRLCTVALWCERQQRNQKEGTCRS